MSYFLRTYSEYSDNYCAVEEENKNAEGNKSPFFYVSNRGKFAHLDHSWKIVVVASSQVLGGLLEQSIHIFGPVSLSTKFSEVYSTVYI